MQSASFVQVPCGGAMQASLLQYSPAGHWLFWGPEPPSAPDSETHWTHAPFEVSQIGAEVNGQSEFDMQDWPSSRQMPSTQF